MNDFSRAALVGMGKGLGIIVVAVGFGFGMVTAGNAVIEYNRTHYPQSSSYPRIIHRGQSEQQYQLQTADLNNNGIPDQFYTIDDKIAVVELDGRPVSDLYLRRPSE